jgi:hypothetical protein
LDRALRFANYLRHRPNRSTRWGNTGNLVRSGIDHYAVQVSGLKNLEHTAIHLVLANISEARSGLLFAHKDR